MFSQKYIIVCIRCFFVILSCLTFISSIGAQTTLPSQLPECPVKRVTDAILSSNDVFWVVGEQAGVYTFDLKDSSNSKWEHVSGDGKFDSSTNYYAIVEDKQGRIWIGTDNQGVLVYDGKEWETYAVDHALLANRVYDLTVSPWTGEIGIATSAGVTVFNPQDQSWKDFTRGNGLREDQVRALEFSEDGGIWFAYACGGLTKGAISRPPTSWQHIQSPWKWDEKGFVRQPLTSSGTGLPSNLNNGLICSSGMVWVATCAGVAYAPVKGGTWKYVRGADWIDKNKGNYNPGKILKWKENQATNLLPQDYVSSLALSKKGGLWVGTRDKGICRWSPQGGILEKINLPAKFDNYEITTLVGLPDGSLGYGTNGQGFSIARVGVGKWKERTGIKRISAHPEYPQLPSDEKVLGLIGRAIGGLETQNDAVYVGEDWMTKGDWPGRYGNVYSLLCSATEGGEERYTTDFIFGKRRKYLTEDMYALLQDYEIEGFLGFHRNADESYKDTIYDDDSRSRSALICPNDFKRKESVWDDSGTNYCNTWDGPDLWVKIIVPEGTHLLDLYYYNSASDMEPDSLKADYYIEMRKELLGNSEKEPVEKTSAVYIEKLYPLPVLARARVHHFSGGGVYQQFAVKGKGTYWFRICRNNSPSAKLNGIFVSKLITPQEFDPDVIRKADHYFGKVLPLPPKLEVNANKEHQEFSRLWEQTSREHVLSPSGQSDFRTGLLYQYRKLARNEENKNLKDILAWNIGVVTKDARQKFDNLMSEGKNIQQERERRLRDQLKISLPHNND